MPQKKKKKKKKKKKSNQIKSNTPYIKVGAGHWTLGLQIRSCSHRTFLRSTEDLRHVDFEPIEIFESDNLVHIVTKFVYVCAKHPRYSLGGGRMKSESPRESPSLVE